MDQQQFEATTFEDLQKLSPEEVAEWYAWEPEPIPLTSFRLHSEEGRQAFLREFYNVGWDWLFQAVNHVWSSLAAPKALRCTRMGAVAGTGGTGKSALVKVLAKFLHEALESITPIPPRADYDNLEAWHEASMLTWHTDEARLQILLQTYANILNGSLLERTSPQSGQILPGPWHW